MFSLDSEYDSDGSLGTIPNKRHRNDAADLQDLRFVGIRNWLCILVMLRHVAHQVIPSILNSPVTDLLTYLFLIKIQ